MRYILIDPELADARDHMHNKQVEMNPTAAKEHVPVVERQIRTIKERVRAHRSRLPFKKLPKALIEGMVLDSIKWINTFPTKGGISNQYGARTLLTGVKLDYNTHCRIETGSYAQVHDEPNITNSDTPRTTGAIAIGNMDNLQGGYYFLNLNTGKPITRRKFDKLPMPNDVIARVEALANSDDTEILFEDRHGNEYHGEYSDETQTNEDMEFPEPYFHNQDYENTGVDDQQDNETEIDSEEPESETEDNEREIDSEEPQSETEHQDFKKLTKIAS